MRFDLDLFRDKTKCKTTEGKNCELVKIDNENKFIIVRVHNAYDTNHSRLFRYTMDGEYIEEYSSNYCDKRNITPREDSEMFRLVTDESYKTKLSLMDVQLNIGNISKNSDVSILSVRDMCRNSYYVIDFDVELSNGLKLQRGLVWSIEQKQSLILSILKDIYIPKITTVMVRINEDCGGEDVIKIVDGKQRMTTLLSFVNGEFGIDVDGETYYFEDLTFACRLKIMGYHFIGTVYYDYGTMTDSDYVKIFEYVNYTGTPQDVEHINKLKTSIK